MPKIASIFVPNMYSCMDCTESHELYGSVQYGLPQQKNISTKKITEFFSRESCPLSSKNVPSLLLTFLSQEFSKISLTLLLMSSQTFDMSFTLPNAFFYNLKMTFSPQKCLFTFLNPRSKGQDEILHFPRSRVMIPSLQNVSFKIKVNFTLLHKCFMKIKSL
jgi:hypothetical protein